MLFNFGSMFTLFKLQLKCKNVSKQKIKYDPNMYYKQMMLSHSIAYIIFNEQKLKFM